MNDAGLRGETRADLSGVTGLKRSGLRRPYRYFKHETAQHMVERQPILERDVLSVEASQFPAQVAHQLAIGRYAPR
jgi:hypothetical protein